MVRKYVYKLKDISPYLTYPISFILQRWAPIHTLSPGNKEISSQRKVDSSDVQ